MIRRLLVLVLVLAAARAGALTNKNSPLKTWGYFHYTGDNTITVWPQKLNYPWVIGGYGEGTSQVTTIHNNAIAAGNPGQVVVYNIGFAAIDTTGPNEDSQFWDSFHVAHPEYQLKNASNNYCFTNDGGAGEVAAMDIGNTAYVDLWIAWILNTIHGVRGYDGTRADYVFRVSDWAFTYAWKESNGSTQCAPYKAGSLYTVAEYRADMLIAIRRIEAAFHAAGLVFLGNHGGAWNDNCDGSHDFANDTSLRDQLAAMDAAQLEFCLYSNIPGELLTTGQGDHEPCALDIIKYLTYGNAHGTTMLCEGYGGSISTARPYVMATELLTQRGQSAVGQLNSDASWSTDYEVKLGPPVPCYWPSLQTRHAPEWASDDECIDGSGNVVPCPGTAYRRRADRREECVDAAGNVVTRGCEGSRLTRRRHFEEQPECVNASGTTTVPTVPFECLNADQTINTSSCPGTGLTYRRQFKYGAAIVNPIPGVQRTIHFGGDPASGWNGPYMDGCVGGGGGLAESISGPTGRVCWYTPTASTTTTTSATSTTTTTTLAQELGFGLVHVAVSPSCDATLTPLVYGSKTACLESSHGGVVNGTSVDGAAWRTMAVSRSACGQTELPVASCVSDAGLTAWDNNEYANLTTIFRALMEADPNYQASGSWTPRVPAIEWGLEENLHAKCCSAAQTNSSSPLYQKLTALQNAKGLVNGGASFKIGYQLAQMDRTATDVANFIASASFSKIDFLGLHPYTWTGTCAGTCSNVSYQSCTTNADCVWPDPRGWFDSFMDAIDGYKSAAGRPTLPIWFTEIGVPEVAGGMSADLQARYVAKIFPIAFSRKVEQVFWYNYKDLGTGCGAECEFGLKKEDGTTRLAYGTYTQVVLPYLHGKHYAGKTTIGSVVVYAFSNGTTTTMVAWRYPAGSSSVALTSLPVNPTTLVDYLGNTVTPSGGNITVTAAPIYMHN